MLLYYHIFKLLIHLSSHLGFRFVYGEERRKKNFSFTITINFPTDLSTVYIKTSNRFISFILISLLVWKFFFSGWDRKWDDFCLSTREKKMMKFSGRSWDFFTLILFRTCVGFLLVNFRGIRKGGTGESGWKTPNKQSCWFKHLHSRKIKRVNRDICENLAWECKTLQIS